MNATIPQNCIGHQGRIKIMGILNLTPDSFSDGGEFLSPTLSLNRVRQMLLEGADIIDIGGESTRPGATPIGIEEEKKRVLPAIKAIKAEFPKAVLSIDTYKAAVAKEAIALGCSIVNDIWGFKHDKDMARVVAASGVECILMHNRETPIEYLGKNIKSLKKITQQEKSLFMDTLILDLLESIKIAQVAGIKHEKIILDIGFGFGHKTTQQNECTIQQLNKVVQLGYPVLVGVSNKSTIGKIYGIESPKERLQGTLEFNKLAIKNGASIIRVHDVLAHKKLSAP